MALLWSPNGHLFFQPIESQDVSGIDIAHATIEETASLRGFKSIEPENFEKFCSAQRAYQEFLSNISASSQILALRFQDIRALILRQRKLLQDYHRWIEDYNTKQKGMSAEISQLINNESMEPPERSCVIRLMEIALEYIDNLMTNPKNHSKYEGAKQRMERYIVAAMEDEFEDEENDALDDIVGSIFERLIKIAFFIHLSRRLVQCIYAGCWKKGF